MTTDNKFIFNSFNSKKRTRQVSSSENVFSQIKIASSGSGSLYFIWLINQDTNISQLYISLLQDVISSTIF